MMLGVGSRCLIGQSDGQIRKAGRGQEEVEPKEQRCPLCAHDRARPSWNGPAAFRGHKFEYVECERCTSVYCVPMPDANVLTAMYGPEYGESFEDGDEAENPRETARVLDLLRQKGCGTFVDYGCGGGDLLLEASKLGWTVLGVEFGEGSARAAAEKTGLRVVPRDEDSIREHSADVVHLGDVIEHLVDVDTEMTRVLRILKPDGILIAQGPLEASPNLFTWILKLKRLVSHNKVTEMAPYHVILATSDGQRAMFRRFGLNEQQYEIREVSWPAPGRLRRSMLSQGRMLVLFVLRKLSQGVSRLCPNRLGNRYFYVGHPTG